MTKKEFSNLSKEKQIVLLKDLGNFLANRKHESFIVSLFTFSEFYVEVWKPIGLDYIQYIEVVHDNSRLDQYLDNLNMDDLDLG